MLEVIQQLQNELIPKYSSHLSSRTLLTSVNFITKSVLQHLHLYHFLLTQPQITNLTTLDLQVDTPPSDIPSLQDGVEQDLWLKMKAKQEIELEYDVKVKAMEEDRLRAISEAEAKLSQTYESLLDSLSKGPVKMSLEEIAHIISGLIKAHIDSSLVTISQSLLRQSVDLDYRLEQLEALAAHEHQSSSRRNTMEFQSLSSGRNTGSSRRNTDLF